MSKINNAKPCPFCGKTKLSLDCKSKNEYKGCFRTYSVRCNSCHARGGTVSGFVKKNHYCTEEVVFISDHDLMDKALELWNTRV